MYFSSLYHHAGFEKNQCINVRTQARIFHFCRNNLETQFGSLPWMLTGQAKMSTTVLRTTNLYCVPKAIKIDWKFCKKIDAECFDFFASLWPWKGSGSLRLISKCRVHRAKFKRKWSINCRPTLSCFPWLKKKLYFNVVRMFALSCFNTTSNLMCAHLCNYALLGYIMSLTGDFTMSLLCFVNMSWKNVFNRDLSVE